MSALPKPATLFTGEMLQKLQEREQELRDGGGFEVQTTAELRAKLEARRVAQDSDEAAA
jgi:hypothetical protein